MIDDYHQGEEREKGDKIMNWASQRLIIII